MIGKPTKRMVWLMPFEGSQERNLNLDPSLQHFTITTKHTRSPLTQRAQFPQDWKEPTPGDGMKLSSEQALTIQSNGSGRFGYNLRIGSAGLVLVMWTCFIYFSLSLYLSLSLSLTHTHTHTHTYIYIYRCDGIQDLRL